MNIIKVIMALGIFICLFLPLSQCTRMSSEAQESISKNETVDGSNLITEDNQGREVKVHIIIDSADDLLNINLDAVPGLIAFILPLIFSISVQKTVWRILFLVLQTANQIWLSFIAYFVVWTFYEPLWGGYILTFCVAAYSLITIIEWVCFFKRKRPVI